MFKVADVQAEDFGDGKGVVVVVYRSKLNETTKKWGKVNMDDPIMVADVEKYYSSNKNRVIMHRKLPRVLASAISSKK